MNESTDPWACTLPIPSAFPLWIEIAEAQFSAPDDVTILFTGRETKPKFRGRKVEITFSSWLDSLDSRVPHMLFGPRCPYALYSGPCGVDPASYAVSATIGAISYQEITVNIGGGAVVDYFTGGRFTVGTTDGTIIRSIIASTAAVGGSVLLTINGPLPASVSIGASCSLLPGCDKTNGAGGCLKFSNTRFGGTPFVPRQNLSFAVADVSGSGGKKGG
jgi:hypothetical protein